MPVQMTEKAKSKKSRQNVLFGICVLTLIVKYDTLELCHNIINLTEIHRLTLKVS